MKRIEDLTGLDVAEMLGLEDVYQLAVITEGYNSDDTEIVGTLDDIE